MKRLSGPDIEAAIREYDDAGPEQLRALRDASSESTEFRAHVFSAIRMMARGHCPAEVVRASLLVMLWAGMAIERKRQEVAALDRLYVQDET